MDIDNKKEKKRPIYTYLIVLRELYLTGRPMVFEELRKKTGIGKVSLFNAIYKLHHKGFIKKEKYKNKIWYFVNIPLAEKRLKARGLI